VSCEGIRLGPYLDGELDAGERADVDAHLGECRACAEELRAITAASAAVKAWRPGRRGFRGLPLVAAAAALVAAALLVVPGGLAPRAEGVVSLRAGERVRHAGVREYVAGGLARPAEIECAGGTLFASHARFRLEDRPMRTRTKVGAAVVATAAVVLWGTIEISDRAGGRSTLGEGTHEIGPPAEVVEVEGGRGAEEPPPPGDPFEAVTGVVLMPDGSPAPEASVALTYPAQYAGGAADQATISDTEGRFRFASAAKPFILAAVKARAGAASGYFTPGAHAVLRLRAGARVEGRLLDEVDGTPVAGCLVSSQMTGGVWGHAREVTGADGRFVLDGLDPDASTLWIRPRAHLDAVVRPRLARGETVALELRLQRAAALRGKVVDAGTGAPVALLEVEVWGNPQRAARLLGDGRFEVEGQRFGTSIVVRAEGYPDTGFSFDDPWGSATRAREQVFRIDRGVLLRLRARDERDRPIAGTRIALLRAGSYWRDLGTAEDGDATVRIPSASPREWLALGQHPGHVFDQTPISPARAGEAVVPLLGRAAGTVVGRVVVKDGRPAAGARIDVGQAQGFALEDGRFRLGGLAPGRAAIRALLDDEAASFEADLRAGEETDVGDVVLRGGATITGFVTRPDGLRVERYEVWAAQRGGAVDADGSFRLTGVEEGRAYEVNVRAGGMTKAVLDVLGGTQSLEIRLDDWATIRGRVIMPEGEAVPVGLSMGCGSPGRPVFCDTRLYMDGSFVVEGIPAGRYTVTAGAEESGYARTEATVEVEALGTAEVEIRLVRGGAVEGTVSSPLPGEKLMVTLTRTDSGATRNSAVRDGVFGLAALAPGEYVAEARTYEAHFRGTRQAVVVRSGETARCDLAVVATGGLVVRATPGAALALLDALGNPVDPSTEERRALSQQLWEAKGRPDVREKSAREALEAEADRALSAADGQGLWRRLALFPGEYVVAAGELRCRAVVRAGETTELDLR
jgi:hypothetical protein